MSPNTLERAVMLSHLDDRLRAILKFKLREFVHLNPCFNVVTPLNTENFSMDKRNQDRLLNLDDRQYARQVVDQKKPCPHSFRMSKPRRKVLRRVAI
mgnify:CR=1 FL=1